MTIRSWLLACAALILFGAATPNARAEPAPDYVKPVPLYAISWGGTYGVSMILTADPTQANALQKLDGAEVGILGYVFNHPMPNTHPIYRLSKPLAGKDSPERYYTTSKAKVEQLEESARVEAVVGPEAQGGADRLGLSTCLGLEAVQVLLTAQRASCDELLFHISLPL